MCGQKKSPIHQDGRLPPGFFLGASLALHIRSCHQTSAKPPCITTALSGVLAPDTSSISSLYCRDMAALQDRDNHKHHRIPSNSAFDPLHHQGIRQCMCYTAHRCPTTLRNHDSKTFQAFHSRLRACSSARAVAPSIGRSQISAEASHDVVQRICTSCSCGAGRLRFHGRNREVQRSHRPCKDHKDPPRFRG